MSEHVAENSTYEPVVDPEIVPTNSFDDALELYPLRGYQGGMYIVFVAEGYEVRRDPQLISRYEVPCDPETGRPPEGFTKKVNDRLSPDFRNALWSVGPRNRTAGKAQELLREELGDLGLSLISIAVNIGSGDGRPYQTFGYIPSRSQETV